MKGDANMIGLDTGFFVELLKAHKEAVELWKKIMDGEDASVSCLSIFELKSLSLKRVIDSEAVETLIEAVLAICKVVWLDNNEVLLSGASLSYGLGIPSMDALILASLAESGAQTIFTTDHHLEGFKKKGIKIFIIKTA
jgi:predicted nucleic acid-binding protein